MNFNTMLLMILLINLFVGNMAQRERQHNILDNQKKIMKIISNTHIEKLKD